MNIREMPDDDLAELLRQATFEQTVRNEMRRMLEPEPCGVIWGPGPPYYCIPKCKVNVRGHKGKCVPDKTKDECREAYYKAGWMDEYSVVRLEAVHRLEAQGYEVH